MRIVVALGGNALLRRGEPLTSDNQRANVRAACRALAPLTSRHELVITHGNGPQVGLLALQSATQAGGEGFPLDVLDAQTEGMLGYLIEQELGNLLDATKPIATLLTMVEVDPADPAFARPTKPIGPIYDAVEAHRLARARGWSFAPDGAGLRRVVPSPLPTHIFGVEPIGWLLERGCVVICTGGGGIPSMFSDDPDAPGRRRLVGVEGVIDKDRSSSLLALEIGADALIIATDVDAVYEDWGGPAQHALERTTPAELAQLTFPEGSMGPKVEAAAAFVQGSGGFAAIGALRDIEQLVGGLTGTIVCPDPGAAGVSRSADRRAPGREIAGRG